VAGYGDLPDGTYHAFRWTASGGLEDLGANGGWFAQAFDINDNGDVVGAYIDSDNNEHAFIAPGGGVMQDLTTAERPIRWVTSITNDGRLAGVLYTQSAAQSHAFRTTLDGTIEDLGSGDRTSVAYRMNAVGDVTGFEWRSLSVFDGVSAFRFSDAAGKVDIGTLGGLSSARVAINSTGVIAGWSYCGNANWSCAFRASPGLPLQDLGTLGGAAAAAESLNDAGDVVGWTIGPTGWTAFVYTDQDGMIDLNTRIPPATGGLRGLNGARAINNAGQIVVE
jgi:probable HAF family extracellular repeat protein